MIAKLLIFGILSSTAIQAFPSDLVPDKKENPKALPSDPVLDIKEKSKKEKACEEKLAWYRDTAKKSHELFDKHYSKYKQHFNLTANTEKKASEIDHLEDENREFQQKMVEALDRYQEDAKKISGISDDSARLLFCRKELDWFKVLNENITGLATNIKTDTLNILDALGVPKEVRDTLDQTLSRIVNFLFIIDMAKNTYKDVRQLYKEAMTQTEDGAALEERYEINEIGEVALADEDEIPANDDERKQELNNEVNEQLAELENKVKEIQGTEERFEELQQEKAAEDLEPNDIDGEEIEGGLEEKPFEFRVPEIIPL